MDFRAGRRAWLIGSVAAALTTTAGAVAIVHYSSLGAVIANGNGPVVATSKHLAKSTKPQPDAPARSPAWSPAHQADGHAPAARHLPGSTHKSPGSHATASSWPAAARQSLAAPIHFRTLPPGARLPSGTQCARLVRASPSPEVRRSNRVFNHTKGELVAAGFLAFDGPKAVRLSRRINGDFTGTTQEILRWAACKWGIDQDMVFAQAAIESWWRQSTLGDWGTDASACPPGHGPGADGRPGQCPQSYGILQNRYPYEKLSWPGIGRSTAMNADTAYAIWRACYDGYETWLNTVPRGSRYHAGDSWGCFGRWFAGRWRTAPAIGYIKAVRKYMSERIWLTPNFKHAN
jgi:autotransporter family porin